MKNIFQTVVSFEVAANAPVELTAEQLRHVAGGFCPRETFTAGVETDGPHDNWVLADGPHDNW